MIGGLRLSRARRSGRYLGNAALQMAPFVLLIIWLALTRLLPRLEQLLLLTFRLKPFEGAPAWSPFFHAGSWLIVGVILTGLARGNSREFPAELRSAWRTGRLAIQSIVAFSVMAELLSIAGIASGLAEGIFTALSRWSILVTPMISAIFGVLTSSGNAANGFAG